MSFDLEKIVYTNKTEKELDNYLIVDYAVRSKTNLADAAWNIALGQSIGNPSARSEWETQELFEKHSCLILHKKAVLERFNAGIMKIAFPETNLNLTEDGISQLFVEVLGGQCDIDIIEKCRVMNISFTKNQFKQFKGPKIGLKEIREYCNLAPDKVIQGSICKPKIGLGPEKYFDLVKCLIDGGTNFIKEDEILSNQDFCPISKRLPKIVNYLDQTKSKVFYCVSINADHNNLLDRVKQVYELGGNGVHVNLHCGFGAYKAIRELDLPILIHYQKSGDKIWTDPGNKFGFSEGTLFKIAALSGCGTAHCGMIGGYLNDDEERTKGIVNMLGALNCVPALSCGMHPGLVNYIKGILGHSNWMANVGGALFSHPMGTLAGVKAMRQAIDNKDGDEYKSAINKWGFKRSIKGTDILKKHKILSNTIKTSKLGIHQGIERLDSVLKLLQIIKDDAIEGDIVETGVYRGAMSILVCKVIEEEFPNKTLYACDSYCGCQDPSTAPYQFAGETHTFGQYAASLAEVKRNFKVCECDMSKVKFIEGYFKDTIPILKNQIDKISLLILDGDMYSSTLEVLYGLYDKVVSGGFVVIDDYNLPPCKSAIDLFFKDKKDIVFKYAASHLPLDLNSKESTAGAWFQKP